MASIEGQSHSAPEKEKAARYKADLYNYKDFRPGNGYGLRADEEKVLDDALKQDGVLGRMTVKNIESTEAVEETLYRSGDIDVLGGEIGVTIADNDSNGLIIDFDYVVYRNAAANSGSVLVDFDRTRSLPDTKYPALARIIPYLVKVAGRISAGSSSAAWGLPMPRGINIPGFREAQEEGERVVERLGLTLRPLMGKP